MKLQYILLSLECWLFLSSRICSTCSAASVTESAEILARVRNRQNCDQWGKTSYKARMITAGVYSEDYSEILFPSLIAIMWFVLFKSCLLDEKGVHFIPFHWTKLFTSFWSVVFVWWLLSPLPQSCSWLICLL